jgi:RNA polymerase sigma factor (sigma-70 family)
VFRKVRSDSELLRTFQVGNDEAAFQELLERHAGMVYNVCNRILASRQDAEDAMQAVFLTLARKAASLQQRTTVAPWLYQVAWHVAMRSRSASKARTQLEQEAAAMKPQSIANAETLKCTLDEALNSLPHEYLQAIVLHHLQGHTEEEGAKLLDIKLGTFSARLSRARELLRIRLLQHGVVFSSVAALQEVCGQAMAAPAPLVSATAKAAVLSRIGEAAAAQVVSPHTLQLFHGALKMLALKQLKHAAAFTTAVLLIAVLGGLFYRSYASKSVGPVTPESETNDNESQEPPQATVAAPSFYRVLGAAPFQAPASLSNLAFSADERYLATAGDKFVTIWEVATGTEIARTSSTATLYDIRFLKDESLLILPNDIGAKPLGFRLWNWRKEKNPRELPVPEITEKFPNNQYVSGRFMTVFPDESIALAPGGTPNGGKLLAFDLKKHAAIAGIDGVNSRANKDTEYQLAAIAVSSDGKQVACVDVACGWRGPVIDRNSCRFTIWDWNTRELKHEWTKTSTNITALRWLSEDGGGRLLASMSNGGTSDSYVLNAADGGVLLKVPGVGTPSPDGTRILAYADGKLHTYSAADGKELSAFDAGEPVLYPWKAACSPSGRYFVLTSNSASLLLIDLNTQTRLAPGHGFRNAPYSMSYAADGRLLAYDGAKTYVFDRDGAELKSFPSQMYCFGRNEMCNDGRILVAHGNTSGQAEIWDTYNGKLLGHLGTPTNAVIFIDLSTDGHWALTGHEYNALIRFFDLTTGAQLGAIMGPTVPFFGPTQDVTRCIWSSDGKTAYLADFSGSFYHLNDRKTNHITGPIGLSGAFDPTTGARKFWFQDPQNIPLESVNVLDLNPAGDTLYVLGATNATETPKTIAVLVSALDGKFIRTVANPGTGARFTPDGKLLVGIDAVVNVQTGAVVHTFGATGAALSGAQPYMTPATSRLVRTLGSSRTQMAEVSAGKIILIDVRTGLAIWQCRIDTRYTEAPRAVLWNMSETQLAISPSTSAGIVQIDLFAISPADKTLDVSDAAKLRGALNAGDWDTRQRAVQSCVEQSAKSLPVLQQLVSDAPADGKRLSETEVLAHRMAILALERIGREQAKLADVSAFLTKTAAMQEEVADLCRDAQIRLTAAERADMLRKNVQKPTPLTWPETLNAAHEGDF